MLGRWTEAMRHRTAIGMLLRVPMVQLGDMRLVTFERSYEAMWTDFIVAKTNARATNGARPRVPKCHVSLDAAEEDVLAFKRTEGRMSAKQR